MLRALFFGSAAAALSAFLGLAPALSQSVPEERTPAAGTAETLDLEKERNERLTVPIRIGGHGPFPFVVDTGSERTVISEELAQRLALAPGHTVQLHSMSGMERVSTALIPELQLSRRKVADIRAPVLRRQDMRAAGILGIDALKSQRVDFDFAKQTMRISPSSVSSSRFLNGTIVVTAHRRMGRLIMTDAQLDGERVTVIVDTGSAVTIGNDVLRQRLKARKKLRDTTELQLISVTGGKVMADHAVLGRMRLGTIYLEEMPVAFADVHPFTQLKLNDRPALILGMDVLTQFPRVSVDFARRKVHFLLPDLSMRKDLRFAGAVPLR